MAKREQSFGFVEASSNYIVQIGRGQQSSRYEVSRATIACGVLGVTLVVASVVGAAGYLLFRDDMLAGLLDRQTQMQYAYEDRLAAVRLRLDQVTSRQFVDQDGVEGKVQNLVIRQAQLETRAAVVAQLVERTVHEASASAVAPRAYEAKAPVADTTPTGAIPPRRPAAAAPLAKPPQGAVDDSVMSYSGKPEPEGMDLRLRDGDLQPLKPPPRKGNGEIVPIDMSFAPRVFAPASSLANAADPDLPITARLESLQLALDRVERDQATRLSGIVKPALEAAGRLRRAFDVAGLPVERYIGRAKSKNSAMGGPFVAAPKGSDALFERELASAQTAVTTLDGLRRALPTVPLRKPLRGELQLTSTFGYRADPFLGRPALHSGVDMREEYGAPVRATAGGVVITAAPAGGYGNMIEIDHGGGFTTRYGHLSAIGVSAGQQVAPGAVIGRVGSTGRSTGPHLHYEVRIDGEAVDPQRFLKAATTLAGITQ
jgi:murein DD-endopeptidase MepM/ murein hydrolase activator NlpD